MSSSMAVTAESKSLIHTIEAKVIIGEETARQLTEITGYLHSPGDVCDLGSIAATNTEAAKRSGLWRFSKKARGRPELTYAEIFEKHIKAVK